MKGERYVRHLFLEKRLADLFFWLFTNRVTRTCAYLKWWTFESCLPRRSRYPCQHSDACIWNRKAEDVTPNMRRQAKQWILVSCMASLITDFHKSRNQPKAAQQYIDTYFENTQVSKNMERIVREAKDQGYVETLYHRRRYLPDINSRNYNIRSFAERTAINTPIQGSAADILKIAMIELDKRLKKQVFKLRCCYKFMMNLSSRYRKRTWIIR